MSASFFKRTCLIWPSVILPFRLFNKDNNGNKHWALLWFYPDQLNDMSGLGDCRVFLICCTCNLENAKEKLKRQQECVTAFLKKIIMHPKKQKQKTPKSNQNYTTKNKVQSKRKIKWMDKQIHNNYHENSGQAALRCSSSITSCPCCRPTFFTTLSANIKCLKHTVHVNTTNNQSQTFYKSSKLPQLGKDTKRATALC